MQEKWLLTNCFYPNIQLQESFQITCSLLRCSKLLKAWKSEFVFLGDDVTCFRSMLFWFLWLFENVDHLRCRLPSIWMLWQQSCCLPSRAYTYDVAPQTFHPLPKDDPKRRCPDISKAKKLLNWQPKISLEQGLKQTIEYLKVTNYLEKGIKTQSYRKPLKKFFVVPN